MDVFLSIKYYPDQRNRTWIEALTQALAGHDLQVRCVMQEIENWGMISLSPRELMQQTFCLLENCELVMVILSEKGVGLGIEAGYAHAKNIPVLAAIPQEADFSNTLCGISRWSIRYNGLDDLTHQVLDAVTELAPKETVER
ncbi:MAG TPA: hypothetical protein PKG95_13170 [Anaerolineaceae bacterium]|nr:hypothetical protein [Anaerolineaceae bacterium]